MAFFHSYTRCTFALAYTKYMHNYIHNLCIVVKKNSIFCIVSAHRRILGMASVVCVLVKICVSSISLYKLDQDKLTTPLNLNQHINLP